jgi:chromosome segregation ATPase
MISVQNRQAQLNGNKKMNHEETEKFKIRMDDEVPEALEPIHPEPSKDDPIDKLKRKFVLLAVLLPCLVIVAFAAGYFEMKKRLANNMDAGTAAVSDLYKEIEARLNEVTENMHVMEEKLTTDVTNFTSAFKGLQSSLNQVKTRSVDKKDQETAISKINEQIAPMQTLIEDLKTDIHAFKESMAKDVGGISQTLDVQDRHIKNIQSKVSSMDKNKIDFTTFRDSLKAETQQLNAANDQLKRDMDKLRIELLKLQTRATAAPGNNGGSSHVIEETIK